jgi:hypothetical protein
MWPVKMYVVTGARTGTHELPNPPPMATRHAALGDKQANALRPGSSGGPFLAAGLPIQPLSRGEPHPVYGLAPDSVTSVMLVTLSGSVTHVPLNEGFFAVRFSVGDRLNELSAGHMKQINPPGLPHR